MNCTYCKRKMHNRKLAFDGLLKTRDHYIPISRGGRNTSENVRAACYKCNHVKGNMMPEVWEKFMLANPEWWLSREIFKRRKRAAAEELRATTAAFRPLRKDEPFPIEYDDPAKQAAWESIYKDRRWLLRVPADDPSL